MPLIRKPSTQDLEDHFFGSGAFTYGWFDLMRPITGRFPVVVQEIDENGEIVDTCTFTEEKFIEGIKSYAETLPDRTFDDLIEDMDAADVDAVIQLAFFGEFRYG